MFILWPFGLAGDGSDTKWIINLRSGSIFVSLGKLHSSGHGEIAVAVRENV